jgi:putative ABC transport system permease protein
MSTPLRPPSVALLAWRQTLRDLRAGELRLLAVAVMLAVAALTAVGFFADRLNSGLARDARQLLGGDAIISSDKPTPPELAAQARAMGLQLATTAAFPSMARAPDDKGGAVRLVSVKAVSDGYPLRGKLQLRRTPGRPGRGAGRGARAGHRVGGRGPAGSAAAAARRPAAAGRRHAAHRPHHRHRARPRRRLHATLRRV